MKSEDRLSVLNIIPGVHSLWLTHCSAQYKLLHCALLYSAGDSDQLSNPYHHVKEMK